MPSASFQNWRKNRAKALDEIEAAHAAVGGSGRGRRYATQQVNFAYAMLLSSQFQGFCRDIHSECVDHLLSVFEPEVFRTQLRVLLTQGRKLDGGNCNPGNIGSDFGRFDLRFWPVVYACDGRGQQRKRHLESLNDWRNAIAHQDFDPEKLGGTTTLRLSAVQSWRKACDGLAQTFDSIMAEHIATITTQRPW